MLINGGRSLRQPDVFPRVLALDTNNRNPKFSRVPNAHAHSTVSGRAMQMSVLHRVREAGPRWEPACGR